MKKVLKIVAIVLFFAFVVIQFFRPDFTNPPVTQAETLEATTQVPENVQAILKRSCKDCHSNETTYPWYSKIQPSAWFLKSHIDDGRRELNFSKWSTYEARRKKRKLDEVCEQVNEKMMPLPSYLWVHWSAKLSDEEAKILCDWATAEKTRLESAP
jgi:Haem-binding domain